MLEQVKLLENLLETYIKINVRTSRNYRLNDESGKVY